MAKLNLLAKGVMSFFAGVIGMILTYKVVDPLLEALTFTDGTTGVIWFFCIIIFVVFCIILPAHYIHQGLTTE